jgi:hypothetical protein
MKVLMRSTKEWADTHGVRFCDDKSKVLVIGKQFSGACEQTGQPGVSKTKWSIGTEEKSCKYLGVTIGKRLEWKTQVAGDSDRKAQLQVVRMPFRSGAKFGVVEVPGPAGVLQGLGQVFESGHGLSPPGLNCTPPPGNSSGSGRTAAAAAAAELPDRHKTSYKA